MVFKDTFNCAMHIKSIFISFDHFIQLFMLAHTECPSPVNLVILRHQELQGWNGNKGVTWINTTTIVSTLLTLSTQIELKLKYPGSVCLRHSKQHFQSLFIFTKLQSGIVRQVAESWTALKYLEETFIKVM